MMGAPFGRAVLRGIALVPLPSILARQHGLALLKGRLSRRRRLLSTVATALDSV